MRTRTLALLSCMACTGVAQAQDWSAEQEAVWEAVSSTWEKDLNKDDSWMRNSLHANTTAWGMDYPAPRDGAAIMRWNKINQQMSSMVAYDLSPLAITVAGDTAMTHYYYSVASKSAEGKNSITHGRCSDTLVRQDARWVFLGWSCSDEPKK